MEGRGEQGERERDGLMEGYENVSCPGIQNRC